MGKKILVVDDAAIMRRVLIDILQAAGYEIIAECSNGDEAVKKFTELKPDLVTMDIIMPGKDGIETLKKILSQDNNAKVIMVTALDQPETLMKAIRAGAFDYIVKPFEGDRVLSAVNMAFEEKS